jgi:hypothetical protein
MDLLQNLLAGFSFVDVRYATVNNAAGDQLIMTKTVDREFIIVLPVYQIFNPSFSVNFLQQKLHWTHFLMPKALLGIRTSYA